MAAVLCKRLPRLAAFSNGGLVGSSVSGRASASPGALARLDEVLAAELEGIKAAGTWKGERVITSPQQAVVRIDGEDVVNFCANNYLGLSSHPEVVEASRSALLTHGAGLSSVRFICGTQDIHKQLEKQLSEFHGRDDCILYPSCFDANTGLFEALLGPDDVVFSDELNHASIIDGLRLCRARKHRYQHLDLHDLEQKLQQNKECRLKLIATDGVFSMDGEVTPLAALSCLAQRHDAILFVDECHATGVLGDTGRGTEEFLGVRSGVHIINSTLGKALGGAAGGYTTGPKSLISLLRQRSRPYLFSNSLPPPVVAAASAALRVLHRDSELCRTLKSNTTWFRAAMRSAGFLLGGLDHPIVPVLLGDARLASVMADDILRKGIYVVGFSYPVVPKGKARIRVQISAAHSQQQLQRCVEAFVSAAHRHGVLA